MAIHVYLLIFRLLAFAYHSIADDTPAYLCNCDVPIDRSSFPNFLFGAAGSAYQMEGAYNIDGKGPSIWDTFTHLYPEKIADQSNGDVATDSYHLYRRDVEVAKELGLDVYRLSLSWARILPKGKLSGGVNQKAVDYYNSLINEALAKGLDPCVTLYHFDVPQALEDLYGGFLSPRIVNDFLNYADLVFSLFGNRVKTWVTINEPWSFSTYAYAYGVLAPGRCNFWHNPNCTGGDPSIEPYLVTHHQLLAHAAAYRLYQQKYKAKFNGAVGITVVSQWFEPFDPNSSSDEEAAERQLDFVLGWSTQPVANGSYPQRMRDILGNRLPTFTLEESQMLTKSYDFLGLNYYSAQFASPTDEGYEPEYLSYLTDSRVNLTSFDIDGNVIGQGPAYNSSWLHIYPVGLRKLLKHIKENYDDPTIFITENGVCTEEPLPMSVSLNDTLRIDYIREHLCCVHEAMEKDEVKVQGHIIWSLMDNFEWAGGYTSRFGLYYVDYESQARIPKESAKWLRGILSKKADQGLNNYIQQQNPIKMPIKNRKMSLY